MLVKDWLKSERMLLHPPPPRFSFVRLVPAADVPIDSLAFVLSQFKLPLDDKVVLPVQKATCPAVPSPPTPEDAGATHDANPFASEVSTLFAPGEPPVIFNCPKRLSTPLDSFWIRT